MRDLRLRKWAFSPGVALNPQERDTLRTVFGASVQPAIGSADTYDVTPGNTIGAITVGATSIVIEPKIAISKVLFLLGYSVDPAHWSQDPADLSTTDDLVSGVVSLFTTLAHQAFHKGLLAGYRETNETSYTVRGRIDLSEQLRRRPGLDIPLAVRYTEYDNDIVENRLLLAAAVLLRTLPIRSAHVRRDLHRITGLLQDVTLINYPAAGIPSVTWTRLNSHYRPAVELARILLARHSPDLRLGGIRSGALTIDMSELFEEFVRSALGEALQVTSAEFPDGEHCPNIHLDTRGNIRLKPDLSWWVSNRCVYVGDVKYKRDGGSGHSDDLYQLLAYATATELDTAMLIYAHGPPAHRRHLVPPTMTELSLIHLDLSHEPQALLAEIKTVADRIRLSVAANLPESEASAVTGKPRRSTNETDLTRRSSSSLAPSGLSPRMRQIDTN